MLKWLIRRRIAAFERAYDYDMSYARDILAVSPQALARFGGVEKLARYRRDVPLEACFAAKLTAAKAEDCGPCTQLVVTMAERAGVAPAVLRAVLQADERAMSADASLGFRFARAVLAHDPEADGLREAVVARWGKHALISLGFAIAATRVFPTVKYALGHGQACTRVTVGGSPLTMLREAA
ncbi:MAG TPA: hypothetical protein VLX85_03945 [Stellaceae bacterium]|nr:hypothetical protein [Stellaceae bacterium]